MRTIASPAWYRAFAIFATPNRTMEIHVYSFDDRQPPKITTRRSTGLPMSSVFHHLVVIASASGRDEGKTRTLRNGEPRLHRNEGLQAHTKEAVNSRQVWKPLCHFLRFISVFLKHSKLLIKPIAPLSTSSSTEIQAIITRSLSH